MALCDQMKARMNDASLLQRKLTDVLVEHAVASLSISGSDAGFFPVKYCQPVNYAETCSNDAQVRQPHEQAEKGVSQTQQLEKIDNRFQRV